MFDEMVVCSVLCKEHKRAAAVHHENADLSAALWWGTGAE